MASRRGHSKCFFFWTLVTSCFFLQSHGFTIVNEEGLKDILLSHLTPEEHHLFFGDSKGVPDFHLVKPSLISNPTPEHPEAKKLKISYADKFFEVQVYPSTQLVSTHLPGVHIDGVLVTLPQRNCHYRFSNETLVVAVNDCHPQSLDAMLLTPEGTGILHPVPSRLLYLFERWLCHSPNPPVQGSAQQNIPQESYVFHILSLVNGSSTPNTNFRTKRSAANEDEEDIDLQEEMAGVCATDDEHDLTLDKSIRERKSLDSPRIRSFEELMPDLEEELENQKNISLRNEFDEADEVDTRGGQLVVRRKTIELAVFCDNVLYEKFPSKLKETNPSKLLDYVLTMLNAIQGIYHQRELNGYIIDIVVIRLDIQTTDAGLRKSGGEIGAYLSEFCSWQKEINPDGEENPDHWDHAIMLSGLDLHSSGNPSVIGLAWVDGMCRASVSCTMNEGRSFLAVYVVAHELGHNLGMNHDGQGSARACNGNQYIMSSSVGPGKTTWSQCSSRVILDFLRKSSCLDDSRVSQLNQISNPFPVRSSGKSDDQVFQVTAHSTLSPSLIDIRENTPGHIFPLTEQCQAMHGRNYYPALTKFDLCDYLYCTNGVVTKATHAALEGSTCGPHRLCFAGKCQPEKELLDYLQSSETITTSAISTSDKLPLESTDAGLPNLTLPLLQEDKVCSELPPNATKIPMEVCQLLAPIFHPMFDCHETCHEYDIYIQPETNKIYKMQQGSIVTDGYESCSPVVEGMTSKIKSDIQSSFDVNSVTIPIRKHGGLCNVIPDFVRPESHCIGTLNSSKKCLPQRIIVGLEGFNATYVRLEGTSRSRGIKWQDAEYSPMTSIAEKMEKQENQNLIDNFLKSFDSGSFSSSSKCAQNEDPVNSIRNIPQEICNYIAPTLHPILNCRGTRRGCTDYVSFINAKDKTVTRVPKLKHSRSEELTCDGCPESLINACNFLKDVLMNDNDIELEPLCHLLPSAWLEFIPDCQVQQSRHLSDDTCYPGSLVVQGHLHDFVYNSEKTDDLGLNHTSVEWRGKPFFLERIMYSATIEDYAQEYKHLDFERRSLAHDDLSNLVTTPDERKFRSSKRMSFSNHSAKLLKENLQKDNGSEIFGNLKEFTGQRDVFLSVTAGETMPQTMVGPCSVSCGQGVRTINVECVDVATEQVVKNKSCPGYVDTEIAMEPCFMPPCTSTRWNVGDWGACSEKCGQGVQFRIVECIINWDSDDLEGRAQLVVEDSQCDGKKNNTVRECLGACSDGGHGNEDNFDYNNVVISKDFDYS